MDDPRSNGLEEAKFDNPPPTPSGKNSIMEKLYKVPGVALAVITDKNGTPLNDQSPNAASLASKGKLLINGALQTGQSIGVGEMRSVAFQDKKYQILVLAAKSQFLIIAVKRDIRLSLVEAEISKLLAGGR
jgi:predicted regulator of Ras-like GTPase activity (Roadblock/LC7/MglB family)